MNRRYYCENCPVRDRALCSVVSKTAAADLQRIAHHRRLPLGHVIHSDAQGPGWLAIVVSGVIKLVKSRGDGRQQIVGLQFPGDLVGRPSAGEQTLIAEATTGVQLCCFARSAFEDVMQRHACVGQALLRSAFDDLDASREWMFLLGRKSAREKVASLLVSIAQRFARSGSGSASGSQEERAKGALHFELPLSRHEIADALGLTIETVSRELKALKTRSLIATSGRRNVVVFRLDALQALAEGEAA